MIFLPVAPESRLTALKLKEAEGHCAASSGDTPLTKPFTERQNGLERLTLNSVRSSHLLDPTAKDPFLGRAEALECL